MLKVSELTRLYGPDQGIQNFRLELKEKDTLLLLGPNGAGKTTAFRSILGLTQKQSGNIFFEGKDTSLNPKEFLSSLGAMVSTPSFYEYMSGYDNLALYSSFYPGVDEKRIFEVLDIVELGAVAHTKVAKYSSGMKQSLDFARAILHRPKMLFLDEPFNGMDIEKKVVLREYLQELGKKEKTAIILSSHMVGDLERFANRVMIVYESQILYDGTTKDALATLPSDKPCSLEEFYLMTIGQYKQRKVGVSYVS